MKNESIIYNFKSYEEYTNFQIKRSKKTQHKTQNYFERYNKIFNIMTELNIHGKSLLCVGARHRFEPDFFKKRNYNIVDAIDLYEDVGIIKCDMSMIHKHDYFINKTYDIVFSNESMEHCIDLSGFIDGLNKVCSGYFVCMCPIKKTPKKWDVAIHPFMSDDNVESINMLEKLFSKFKVIYHNIEIRKRRANQLFFILQKKDSE